jgi:hypothetical protein
VQNGVASTRWNAAASDPTGDEQGQKFTDYDIEAAIGAVVRRSPDQAEFRVFSAEG